MAKGTAEERILAYVEKIKDKPIREMLTVCQERRKVPRDCLTDGSLEEFAKRILALEERAGSNG